MEAPRNTFEIRIPIPIWINEIKFNSHPAPAAVVQEKEEEERKKVEREKKKRNKTYSTQTSHSTHTTETFVMSSVTFPPADVEMFANVYSLRSFVSVCRFICLFGITLEKFCIWLNETCVSHTANERERDSTVDTHAIAWVAVAHN